MKRRVQTWRKSISFPAVWCCFLVRIKIARFFPSVHKLEPRRPYRPPSAWIQQKTKHRYQTANRRRGRWPSVTLTRRASSESCNKQQVMNGCSTRTNRSLITSRAPRTRTRIRPPRIHEAKRCTRISRGRQQLCLLREHQHRNVMSSSTLTRSALQHIVFIKPVWWFGGLADVRPGPGLMSHALNLNLKSFLSSQSPRTSSNYRLTQSVCTIKT